MIRKRYFIWYSWPIGGSCIRLFECLQITDRFFSTRLNFSVSCRSLFTRLSIVIDDINIVLYGYHTPSIDDLLRKEGRFIIEYHIVMAQLAHSLTIVNMFGNTYTLILLHKRVLTFIVLGYRNIEITKNSQVNASLRNIKFLSAIIVRFFFLVEYFVRFNIFSWLRDTLR